MLGVPALTGRASFSQGNVPAINLFVLEEIEGVYMGLWGAGPVYGNLSTSIRI